MRNLHFLLLLIALSGSIAANAQPADSTQSKFLSLGTKKTGICFGNSRTYAGLRFNLVDKKVYRVNGLNASLLNTTAQVFNGIAIGGLVTNVSKLNGIGIAGFGISGDTLNGMFIAGWGIGKFDPNYKISKINGVAITVFGMVAKDINGLAISIFHNKTTRHQGLSISIFNKTQKLRGMQIGLLNYAGNNPRGLRWLPIMNFHLGKK